MPTYHITVGDKEYNVEVPDPRERPVRAIVNGAVLEVHVADNPDVGAAPGVRPAASIPAAPPIPRPTAGAAAPGVITAPLPGVITKISVKVGDKVAVGQELCILEAMKMNNPIRATAAGTVTEIYVNVGQQVQHGNPLVALGA